MSYPVEQIILTLDEASKKDIIKIDIFNPVIVALNDLLEIMDKPMKPDYSVNTINRKLGELGIPFEIDYIIDHSAIRLGVRNNTIPGFVVRRLEGNPEQQRKMTMILSMIISFYSDIGEINKYVFEQFKRTFSTVYDLAYTPFYTRKDGESYTVSEINSIMQEKFPYFCSLRKTDNDDYIYTIRHVNW